MSTTNGIIATGHELTAAAAEAMMREGGNAFDAALAALAAACVVEPVLASLGGGGFLLARPASGPARVYDFFVQTPRRRLAPDEIEFYPVNADFGATQQEFHIGRGTLATPGVVRGMFAIHGDLATMPIRSIFSPAVEYAAQGVRVNDYQAYLFNVVKTIFAASDEVKALYASKQQAGELVRAGERLVQPELADTLETLAIEGEELFYRGEIAAAIGRDAASGGGQIGLQDLAAYEVAKREPLCIDYRGTRVLANPPPASGGLLVGFGLALLAEQAMSDLEFGSPEHLHLLARTLEATSEARVEAEAEKAPGLTQLLDPVLIAQYRERLHGRVPARRGTTQMSIVDSAGNIASLTVSNGEGSGYVVPGTGVVMNNMLGEADLNPTGFQTWPEDERMTSMMCPSVVLWPDGGVVATGSGGSNRIRSAVLQVLMNIIDFKMDIAAAVDAPRLHFEDGLLSIEGGFDLDRLGSVIDSFPEHHVWPQRNMFFGGAHSARRSPRGGFDGAGDARRNGVCTKVG